MIDAETTSPDTALMLPGGGARGAYQVGVIQAELREIGCRAVEGSSKRGGFHLLVRGELQPLGQVVANQVIR